MVITEHGQVRWRRITRWKAEILKGDLIVSAWTTDDVIAQAKEDGFQIDEDQARMVLNRIEQDSDSQIGINWTVISSTIAEVLEAG